MKDILKYVALIISVFSMFNALQIEFSHSYNNSPTAIVPTQAGTINITGHWWYWYNTTHGLPITKAKVEIYDEETAGTDYLGSTYTDYNGYYSFGPISNNDGPGEDGLDIIVTVNATSSAARVINSTGVVYSYQTPTFEDVPDGTIDINWPTPYDQRGAWWIFCSHFGLTRGWYYLHNEVNYNTARATARWPYEEHPHYHFGGEIHLPDSACWSHDSILHEYAHHVMWTLYGDLPPSMTPHYMTQQSNSTTAWVEGWAHFFPLAVFNDPIYTIAINATHGLSYDLEAHHWCSDGWDDGDEVEGRVAGALWDIFDSQNDSAPWYYDSFSDGFHRIWNITRDNTLDTFKEFWDAWNATYYTHPKSPSSPYDLQDWTNTLMAIFQNSIDYRGPGDVDADGRVRVDDVLHVALLFGTNKGNQEWDKRADFVVPYPGGDDKIQVDDVYFVQGNFGKNYDC